MTYAYDLTGHMHKSYNLGQALGTFWKWQMTYVYDLTGHMHRSYIRLYQSQELDVFWQLCMTYAYDLTVHMHRSYAFTKQAAFLRTCCNCV